MDSHDAPLTARPFNKAIHPWPSLSAEEQPA